MKITISDAIRRGMTYGEWLDTLPENLEKWHYFACLQGKHLYRISLERFWRGLWK